MKPDHPSISPSPKHDATAKPACCDAEVAAEAAAILADLHAIMRRIEAADLPLAAARLSAVIDAVEADVMAMQCMIRLADQG